MTESDTLYRQQIPLMEIFETLSIENTFEFLLIAIGFLKEPWITHSKGFIYLIHKSLLVIEIKKRESC